MSDNNQPVPRIENFEVQSGPLPGYALVVYVKIPDPVLPTERLTKYEEPLEDTLAADKLGIVTCGGTMTDTSGSTNPVRVGLMSTTLRYCIQKTMK